GPASAGPTRPLPTVDLSGAVVWEGGVWALHSLALVNRALCLRLLERGVPLTLLPTDGPADRGPHDDLPQALAERCGRPPDGPTAVHIRHQWPPNWEPPPQGHWVVTQPW